MYHSYPGPSTTDILVQDIRSYPGLCTPHTLVLLKSWSNSDPCTTHTLVYVLLISWSMYRPYPGRRMTGTWTRVRAKHGLRYVHVPVISWSLSRSYSGPCTNQGLVNLPFVPRSIYQSNPGPCISHSLVNTLAGVTGGWTVIVHTISLRSALFQPQKKGHC